MPINKVMRSPTAGSRASKRPGEDHRAGHDHPEGGGRVTGEMQGHGTEIQVLGVVAQQQGRDRVACQPGRGDDHHQLSVHLGRMGESVGAEGDNAQADDHDRRRVREGGEDRGAVVAEGPEAVAGRRASRVAARASPRAAASARS